MTKPADLPAADLSTSRDEEIAGRERYHGIRECDLAAELDGAELTSSALARVARGAYQRAAVPATAKAHARGMLYEAEAPKRPCGFSGVLCGHRHGAKCPGRWVSLRKQPEDLAA